ncbi:excalibur calcium-binding domain-containing protein [Streptomyces sp. NBC_00038]|uniref:excalibur calcium-binding domain-containing protein n=1 Tax=Streptomyces sp. NBC_00038 TaxID=2903615 RepID=UPI002250CE5F|nr:excalibur calcium-binding domain-containing protein [Streptomyces sp. NBC_00038]MCX5555620.1 excalibur calcium-binding domain-containing protein [Streptomyces sp. NBC_00038]
MTNPYTPPSGAPARIAPGWARKRFVLPALALAFFIGIGAGSSGDDKEPATAKPQPTATVTATTTATATETATAAPAATVTVRATTTVRTTVTAQPAADSGNTDDSSGGSGDVYYENCDAARAAGAAPVRTGDPGYGRHLDRDGDGVGCE